jgi:DNA-binding transcriptional MerR regulator
MTETPYVTIDKVAAHFQVSVSTIRKWTNTGILPASTYISVGEIYRYRLDDIEAALTDRNNQGQNGSPTNNGEEHD